MKIVLLGHLHGYGGAEKSLIMLANQLVIRGYEVWLVTITSNNIMYELDDRVQVYFIEDKGKNKITIFFNRIKALYDFYMKDQCDLVISFWLQIGLISMIMSKYYGFKIIYSERGDPADIEYKGINGFFRNMLISGFDGFVFQTKGARDFFKDKVRNRSIIIHNAVVIDEDILRSKIDKKKYIVGIGRLHRQKNFALLIKAFSKITKEFPQYKLIIYGEGGLRRELEELVIKLGLKEMVILFGNTKEPLNKLLEAEIFVLSSDFEGMPNVLLEAMALGVPCISTDCSPGGAAELIENRINGILVERNNEEKLAMAIKEMLENPKKAAKYGKEAVKIKESHCVEFVYNQWQDFIQYILKNK